MGAATVTIDNDGVSPQDASAGFAVRCAITLSNSYATGGDTITAAQFALGTLSKIVVTQEGKSGYIFTPNISGLKIQAFYTGSASDDPLNEVTSTTDLSAIPFGAIAYGT